MIYPSDYSAMAGSASKKAPSVPNNWPNPTEEDLKDRPNRIVNIGRAQDYTFPNNFVKTSKYEWYNFIPRFLMEEFNPKTKVANCYFLLIAILQTVPSITNTEGYPTVMIPLTFVVVVDSIFAALEDYARHKADKEANSTYVKRYDIHNKDLENLKWSDLEVGDFVQIHSREKIPADLVVIGVAEKTNPPMGMCYVETKSLDGETNLKMRQALPGTLAECKNFSYVQHLKGKIEMEHPNKVIDSFTGVIEIEGIGREPILPQNVVLRGCVLRNTEWIIGCVVNTGHHTKILMSAAKTPSKSSQLDTLASIEVIHMVYLLASVCLVGALGSLIWNIEYDVKGAWYFDWGDINYGAYFVIQYFYFFLLHATFIPVSLYVSMTLIRFFQSYFMNNDLEMYYEKTDTPSVVRTMTLNEELGQISHVFSDKTGTLTCNVMDFRKASINGVSYGLGITEIGKASWKLQGKELPQEVLEGEENAKKASVPHVSFYDPKYGEDKKKGGAQETRMSQFFRILSLCHDTIPERIDGKIKLSASNPDDECLVFAAKYFGAEFVDKQEKYAIIKIDGVEERVEVLEVIGFTSKRKRMSVIVKDPDGVIRMVIKGADSTMIPRLHSGQDQLLKKTDDHMSQYAVEGLRCLLVGFKELDNEEYHSWSEKYNKYSTSLDELEKKKKGLPNKIEEAEDEIERNITLVGATAIEDKLQDGVPEAIAQIAKAGINVWVLTGDKEETAINIAVACNLVLPKQYMKHVIVNNRTAPSLAACVSLLSTERADMIREQNNNETHDLMPRALIIDGPTLLGIMGDDKPGGAKESLLEFSKMCKAVVGCRVSPDQKREMVNMIKTGIKGVRTLSIGDGANDVAMIQEAHIGVGIRGEEGLQATNASDYAIAQFRFLAVLLLKHGRYNYIRMSKLIIYMFYKNVMMSICHFWFSWMNGFSGQKIYTEGSIQFYNLLYTSLPILLVGIYDMDVPKSLVYRFPQLYQSGIDNEYFNVSLFWFQLCNAVVDSVIISYLSVFMLVHFSELGMLETFWESGALTYTVIIVLANVKVSFLTAQWNIVHVCILLLSVGLWFGTASFISNYVILDRNWFKIWPRLLDTSNFWLALICICGVVIIKDVYIMLLKLEFDPSKAQVMLESQCIVGRRSKVSNSQKPQEEQDSLAQKVEMFSS